MSQRPFGPPGFVPLGSPVPRPPPSLDSSRNSSPAQNSPRMRPPAPEGPQGHLPPQEFSARGFRPPPVDFPVAPVQDRIRGPVDSQFKRIDGPPMNPPNFTPPPDYRIGPGGGNPPPPNGRTRSDAGDRPPAPSSTVPPALSSMLPPAPFHNRQINANMPPLMSSQSGAITQLHQKNLGWSQPPNIGHPGTGPHPPTGVSAASNNAPPPTANLMMTSNAVPLQTSNFSTVSSMAPPLNSNYMTTSNSAPPPAANFSPSSNMAPPPISNFAMTPNMVPPPISNYSMTSTMPPPPASNYSAAAPLPSSNFPNVPNAMPPPQLNHSTASHIGPPPISMYQTNSTPSFPNNVNQNLPPMYQPNSYSGPSAPPVNPSNHQNFPQPMSQPGVSPPVQPSAYGQYPNMAGPVAGSPQYPGQYNGQQDLNQQMGKLQLAQGSINKLWGNENVDLLQCRNILPEGKVEPPQVKLTNHFANSINCSPDIFRCTLTKIPETNSLLQKSRLPLGILVHPFKDLTHLPVIQCSSIVRCRSCRTYINPFVYFIDLKRWKCNLCYRVNDLPEEFQYDPVTKSYGDPTRRPEIQSATIEYIAPSEYMLRPPQPAAYLFLLDVSASAAESGYLKLFCETLLEQIDNLPGDSRTQLAFICYDSAIHFYFLGENASRPKEMTVIDIEDIFLPSPEDLLVNLAERRTAIIELLTALPNRHASPSPAATQSALGAALQAALKLMSPTGGRVTVFQTCLPNVGPGALLPREDPNNRSSKEVAHLNPATDFYKRQALNCSGVQVAVDLFLLNSQYADLSTISGISRFSGGTVYHIPLFKASREWQYQELKRCLTRYLTRKIGFEAVMRVRCTRGLAIHAFHGSFFVRSTDLLSLPNISPDAGFGMQLAIEENLSDAQHVCFQAALLYTSSKGERRIRVHTLCLPVSGILTEIIHSADQQCIIGLLSKMAVDRSQSSSLSDAREALINAAVDALGTIRVVSGPSHGLMCSMALRLVPLYLLALLKYKAFRTGTSTRLDDRIAAMCHMKSLPLGSLIRTIYPDLYPVHRLADFVQPVTNNEEGESDEIAVPNPPRLRLSAEKVSATGAYLLDQEDSMVLYIGHTVHPTWLRNTLGVEHHSQISDDGHSIPTLETDENSLLHSFIDFLNYEKPYIATLHVIRDNSPNRSLFIDKLVDDRVESALSYYEFLQHIKAQIK